MKVSGEEVRRRLAARSTAQLKTIVASPGQYTDDARRAAAGELQRREEAKEAAQNAGPQPHAATYHIEDAIFDPFVVPPHVPKGIRNLFPLGVSAALSGVLLLAVALIEYLVSGDIDHFLSFVFDARGIYVLILGFAGLLLAYGIRTERAYPQILAALVVIVSACAGILDVLMRFEISSEIVSIAAGAFTTVIYLFRSDEAIRYYGRLRER